jgi:hypothetical protein
VILAGPVTFGCPDAVDGAGWAEVAVAAAAPEPTWPAVGSTACGWAFGIVPVAVEEGAIDEVVPVDDGWALAVCAVPVGRWALEPQPAASTITAIAVTPAARMR